MPDEIKGMQPNAAQAKQQRLNARTCKQPLWGGLSGHMPGASFSVELVSPSLSVYYVPLSCKTRECIRIHFFFVFITKALYAIEQQRDAFKIGLDWVLSSSPLLKSNQKCGLREIQEGRVENAWAGLYFSYSMPTS
jgi:hypothetical protein